MMGTQHLHDLLRIFDKHKRVIFLNSSHHIRARFRILNEIAEKEEW